MNTNDNKTVLISQTNGTSNSNSDNSSSEPKKTNPTTNGNTTSNNDSTEITNAAPRGSEEPPPSTRSLAGTNSNTVQPANVPQNDSKLGRIAQANPTQSLAPTTSNPTQSQNSVLSLFSTNGNNSLSTALEQSPSTQLLGPLSTLVGALLTSGVLTNSQTAGGFSALNINGPATGIRTEDATFIPDASEIGSFLADLGIGFAGNPITAALGPILVGAYGSYLFELSTVQYYGFENKFLDNSTQRAPIAANNFNPATFQPVVQIDVQNNIQGLTENLKEFQNQANANGPETHVSAETIKIFGQIILNLEPGAIAVVGFHTPSSGKQEAALAVFIPGNPNVEVYGANGNSWSTPEQLLPPSDLYSLNVIKENVEKPIDLNRSFPAQLHSAWKINSELGCTFSNVTEDAGVLQISSSGNHLHVMNVKKFRTLRFAGSTVLTAEQRSLVDAVNEWKNGANNFDFKHHARALAQLNLKTDAAAMRTLRTAEAFAAGEEIIVLDSSYRALAGSFVPFHTHLGYPENFVGMARFAPTAEDAIAHRMLMQRWKTNQQADMQPGVIFHSSGEITLFYVSEGKNARVRFDVYRAGKQLGESYSYVQQLADAELTGELTLLDTSAGAAPFFTVHSGSKNLPAAFFRQTLALDPRRNKITQ